MTLRQTQQTNPNQFNTFDPRCANNNRFCLMSKMTIRIDFENLQILPNSTQKKKFQKSLNHDNDWINDYKISENLAQTLFFTRTGFNMIQVKYSFTFFWKPSTMSGNNINNTIFQLLLSLLPHVPVCFTIRIPHHSLAFMLYYCQKSKHYKV